MKLNKLIIPVLVLSGLFLFLLLSDPESLPLIALLIPFGLFGVVAFYLFRLTFKHVMGYSKRTSNIAALLLASEATLLLLLSSLDQLELGDFIIMAAFGGLLVWYISKFHAQ